MMGRRIVILMLAALICQAGSQICVNPCQVPQVVTNPTIVAAPQVLTSPIVATTIVDNSVSTALANALQLLIVSDIIETKLGATCLNNLLNIKPVLETVTPCCPRIEVTEYMTPAPPCVGPVEIISPFRPVVETFVPNCGIAETIYNRPCGVVEPYSYTGCPEVVTPTIYQTVAPSFGFTPCGAEIINPCLPNCLPEVITPSNYYGVAEIINPFCGCGAETVTPYSFAPICSTDVVTVPSYNPGCFGGCNEIFTPIPYNPCGVTEVISPPCYGLPEVITPTNPCNCRYFGNVAEFLNPCNTFNGISDLITPISPLSSGCVPEVTPCSQFYGGAPEVISPIYKPGCSGIPEFIPATPCGRCRIPEFIEPCNTCITPCAINFPDIILHASYNTGCSGCEFCGPPAFSPNFCF